MGTESLEGTFRVQQNFYMTLFIFLVLAVAEETQAHSDRFDAWATTHGKFYSNIHERAHALQNFIANDLVINAHNSKKNQSFVMAHNQFRYAIEYAMNCGYRMHCMRCDVDWQLDSSLHI